MSLHLCVRMGTRMCAEYFVQSRIVFGGDWRIPNQCTKQKSSHDFKEKDPCARVGTLEPMRIKAILT